MPVSVPGQGCGSLKIKGNNVAIPCDWEKIACRLGGRRRRTACHTVSDGDRADFIAYKVAGHLHEERAKDFFEAWGWTGADATFEGLETVGITKADLAVVHLDSLVPKCLDLEAGRHTCHPNESPGKLFYDAAREQLQDDIRNGRLRWTRPPRGSGGNDPVPSPRPGQPGGPAGPPSPGDAMGNGPRTPGGGTGPLQAGFSGSGVLLLAAAALLLLKGRG